MRKETGGFCVALLILAGVSARAESTWDIAPGVIGAGDLVITPGAGTWDTSTGNWTVDGGTNNVAWVNGSDAYFGIASAYTVAIGSGTAITVNNLTLESNNKTLTLQAATDNEGITVFFWESDVGFGRKHP